jgi:hypothetical protein
MRHSDLQAVGLEAELRDLAKKNGRSSVVAKRLHPQDITALSNGDVYITDSSDSAPE